MSVKSRGDHLAHGTLRSMKSLTTPEDACAAVHVAALSLPRFDHRCPRGALPADGIYFFFEKEETAAVNGVTIQRIVRVGTHREDGRFPGRIRQHYGRVNSLSGNKNSSVFRRHVGGALLMRSNPADPRIAEWQRQGGTSFTEVEELVSETLRECFTFACFSVPTREERLTLERGLIALLAKHPLAAPSSGWLGRYATTPNIRRTGLWNTQHCDSLTLTADELERFKVRAVEAAL